MEIEVNIIIKMMEGGIMICCLSEDRGVDGGRIGETDYLVK